MGKKSNRFLKNVALSSFFALAFFSCKNFTDQAADYLNTYGNVATVSGVSYSREGIESGGYYNIDSSADFTIEYAIDNPGNSQLSADNLPAGQGISPASVTVNSKNLISLTFAAADLAALDGKGELSVISPTLCVYAIASSGARVLQCRDQRALKCNSPPPKIPNALSQMQTSAALSLSGRLVLALELPLLSERPEDLQSLVVTDKKSGEVHSFAFADSEIAEGAASGAWTITRTAPEGIGATYDGGPVFAPTLSAEPYYILTDIENLPSLEPWFFGLALLDTGGLSTEIEIPSHALKLDPPTCSDYTGALQNTLSVPYAEFTIYAPENASDATLYFAVTDSDGNAVSATNGSAETSQGSATFRLYPKEDGSAQTYTIRKAYASKTGYVDSNDAAAGFGSGGTIVVSGATLSVPALSLVDGQKYPQGTTCQITSAEDGSIWWIYSVGGHSGMPQGDDPSPASVELEDAGVCTLKAYAHKSYYKNSDITQATWIIARTRAYVKSDGNDGGYGTKESPFKTFARAVEALNAEDATSSTNTIFVLDDMTSLESGLNIGSGYYNIVGCKDGTAGGSVKLNTASDGTVFIISGGTITLRALTITGNVNSSNGAAYVTGGTLVVKDNVNITGNKTALGEASNVHVAYGQKITVDSNGMSGSKLGVTSGVAPTGGHPVTITSGYSAACGTTAPSTYFTSDKAAYAVVFDSAETEAVLATGGGGIDIDDIYTVGFYYSGGAGVVSFTAYAAPEGGGSYAVITDEITSWNMDLYYLNTYTGASFSSNTANLSAFANGTYIMKITVVYKGKAYSGEVEFSK